MTIPHIQGAAASTDSAAQGSPNGPTDGLINRPANGQPPEPVRHLLFGSPSAVRTTIYHLHHLSYAEPNDWSQPISTGRPNEVMAVFTQRVKTE
ncbi:MAG: hypothetical protein WBD47_18515 [Phormidesmis sp.]